MSSILEAFKQIKSSIAATAIVSLQQARLDPEYEDADDYVETMTIIESLMARGGLDHRDIVARLREGRPTEIDGNSIRQGGNRNRMSQVAKLRESTDPLYMARSGITDGAAMHVLGPALYFVQAREMVSSVNFISRITHASDESALAAILVALRIRQAFMQPSTPKAQNELMKVKLLEQFHRAATCCGLETSRAYNFIRIVLTIVIYQKTEKEIIDTAGLLHVATSTPVAAVAASFLPDKYDALDLKHFLSSQIRSSDEAVERHRRHFQATTPEEVLADGADGYRFTKRADVDTYASILCQIRSIRDPIDEHVIEKTREAYFEDWDEKAWALAYRGWIHE